jgi:hypothetical protein
VSPSNTQLGAAKMTAAPVTTAASMSSIIRLSLVLSVMKQPFQVLSRFTRRPYAAFEQSMDMTTTTTAATAAATTKTARQPISDVQYAAMFLANRCLLRMLKSKHSAAIMEVAEVVESDVQEASVEIVDNHVAIPVDYETVQALAATTDIVENVVEVNVPHGSSEETNVDDVHSNLEPTIVVDHSIAIASTKLDNVHSQSNLATVDIITLGTVAVSDYISMEFGKPLEVIEPSVIEATVLTPDSAIPLFSGTPITSTELIQETASIELELSAIASMESTLTTGDTQSFSFSDTEKLDATSVVPEVVIEENSSNLNVAADLVLGAQNPSTNTFQFEFGINESEILDVDSSSSEGTGFATDSVASTNVEQPTDLACGIFMSDQSFIRVHETTATDESVDMGENKSSGVVMNSTISDEWPATKANNEKSSSQEEVVTDPLSVDSFLSSSTFSCVSDLDVAANIPISLDPSIEDQGTAASTTTSEVDIDLLPSNDLDVTNSDASEFTDKILLASESAKDDFDNLRQTSSVQDDINLQESEMIQHSLFTNGSSWMASPSLEEEISQNKILQLPAETLVSDVESLAMNSQTRATYDGKGAMLDSTDDNDKPNFPISSIDGTQDEAKAKNNVVAVDQDDANDEKLFHFPDISIDAHESVVEAFSTEKNDINQEYSDILSCSDVEESAEMITPDTNGESYELAKLEKERKQELQQRLLLAKRISMDRVSRKALAKQEKERKQELRQRSLLAARLTVDQISREVEREEKERKQELRQRSLLAARLTVDQISREVERELLSIVENSNDDVTKDTSLPFFAQINSQQLFTSHEISEPLVLSTFTESASSQINCFAMPEDSASGNDKNEVAGLKTPDSNQITIGSIASEYNCESSQRALLTARLTLEQREKANKQKQEHHQSVLAVIDKMEDRIKGLMNAIAVMENKLPTLDVQLGNDREITLPMNQENDPEGTHSAAVILEARDYERSLEQSRMSTFNGEDHSWVHADKIYSVPAMTENLASSDSLSVPGSENIAAFPVTQYLQSLQRSFISGAPSPSMRYLDGLDSLPVVATETTSPSSTYLASLSDSLAHFYADLEGGRTGITEEKLFGSDASSLDNRSSESYSRQIAVDKSEKAPDYMLLQPDFAQAEVNELLQLENIPLQELQRRKMEVQAQLNAIHLEHNALTRSQPHGSRSGGDRGEDDVVSIKVDESVQDLSYSEIPEGLGTEKHIVYGDVPGTTSTHSSPSTESNVDNFATNGGTRSAFQFNSFMESLNRPSCDTMLSTGLSDSKETLENELYSLSREPNTVNGVLNEEEESFLELHRRKLEVQTRLNAIQSEQEALRRLDLNMQSYEMKGITEFGLGRSDDFDAMSSDIESSHFDITNDDIGMGNNSSSKQDGRTVNDLDPDQHDAAPHQAEEQAYQQNMNDMGNELSISYGDEIDKKSVDRVKLDQSDFGIERVMAQIHRPFETDVNNDLPAANRYLRMNTGEYLKGLLMHDDNDSYQNDRSTLITSHRWPKSQTSHYLDSLERPFDSGAIGDLRP